MHCIAGMRIRTEVKPQRPPSVEKPAVAAAVAVAAPPVADAMLATRVPVPVDVATPHAPVTPGSLWGGPALVSQMKMTPSQLTGALESRVVEPLDVEMAARRAVLDPTLQFFGIPLEAAMTADLKRALNSIGGHVGMPVLEIKPLPEGERLGTVTAHYERGTIEVILRPKEGPALVKLDLEYGPYRLKGFAELPMDALIDEL